MIGQSIIEMIKANLLEYGAAFVNSDYKYPQEGSFKIGTFPFKLNFKYKDLVHDPVSFNMH